MFIRRIFANSWAVVVAALLLVTACQDQARLKTEQDKLAYSIGYSMGKNIQSTLESRGDKPNVDHLMAGIRAAMRGSSDVMADEEILGILGVHQEAAEEKARKDALLANAENLKAGTAYLEGNKDRAGVSVLPSGVQFKILEKGDGIRPTKHDTVLAHYVGRFINGEEFEGTYEKGEPIYFPLSRVIPGWQEVVQMMPVGSKWEVTVPSELAYGERGTPTIEPNSTLIFEMELLGIKGKTIDVK
ncbi:MAG: FKBP-type peptidyl-prolyl cis-trans isomerase [Candidatus Latescibacterota bacterium]|nr:FKBP-type peptidyl-prolyl cis-trans isomerase [Candidatus Latescibacterota bacterium]